MNARVLFLADIDSSHSRKWITGVAERGFEVAIFSLRKSESNWFRNYPTIKVYDADWFSKEKFSKSSFSKLSYLKLTGAVKKAIADFKPDLLHSHYATSYGLLGVRSGFHPHIISAWGSDVFEFPKKSFLHRFMVKRNLRKADAVFTTSEVMKTELLRLGREAVVTPFGIDTTQFSQRPSVMFDAETKVIGTVKSLENVYGIDTLILAFEKLRPKYDGKLKLVICGEGTQEGSLKKMAMNTACADDIIFTGRIAQEEVPKFLNQFTIFANLSRQESFGVSVLEAMACALPCVISDAVGLKEISANGQCAAMVKAEDADGASKVMQELLADPASARMLGDSARQRVVNYYDWRNNLDKIVILYRQIINR
jgi:L-malate glycosyltransferase